MTAGRLQSRDLGDTVCLGRCVSVTFRGQAQGVCRVPENQLSSQKQGIATSEANSCNPLGDGCEVREKCKAFMKRLWST